MSREEITAVITEIGDMATAIAGAPTDLKGAVYQRLGLRLTYHPDKAKVRAEIDLSPHIVKGFVSEGDTFDTYMPFTASARLILPVQAG